MRLQHVPTRAWETCVLCVPSCKCLQKACTNDMVIEYNTVTAGNSTVIFTFSSSWMKNLFQTHKVAGSESQLDSGRVIESSKNGYEIWIK